MVNSPGVSATETLDVPSRPRKVSLTLGEDVPTLLMIPWSPAAMLGRSALLEKLSDRYWTNDRSTFPCWTWIPVKLMGKGDTVNAKLTVLETPKLAENS